MGAPLRLALTALSDSLNRPAGLAFDSTGDLYAADSANNTLVSLAHGVLSSGFNSPIGLAITPNDDFAFIADRANHAIRLRYPGDASLGFVTTIGGLLGQPGYADGLYEVTRFNEPSAIAADPRDRLYVADTGNHRIRKLTTVTGYVGYYSTATFAGAGEGAEDGAALSARFSRPAGIAVDGEAIVFVADTGNHTIRKIENGIVTTIAGRAGVTGNSDGAGDAARFNSPTALAVDARGNLYVCDSGNNTIRKIAPSGVVTTIADGLANPSGIAIDATGAVYISDTANHRVVAGHIADAPPGPRRRAVKP